MNNIFDDDKQLMEKMLLHTVYDQLTNQKQTWFERDEFTLPNYEEKGPGYVEWLVKNEEKKEID